jgi:hypothetical protein
MKIKGKYTATRQDETMRGRPGGGNEGRGVCQCLWDARDDVVVR